MLRLAWRQLLLDPVRTALTCFAIGAVIAVILILEGFLQGLYEQSRLTVLERGGDLIVTQAGVANLTAARSTLPQLTRAQVEAIPGVEQAYPMTGISIIYEQQGRRTPLFLIVHEELGGPKRIIQGKHATGGRQIVIDWSLARKYDLKPGDELVASGFRFRIVGITENASAILTGFGFINYDTLIDFYFDSDVAADISTFPLLSFLLVKLKKDADAAVVARAIEARVKSADVFTPAELARLDKELVGDLFGPIMGLLVGVAYLIGVFVVGLIMYADISSRTRTFGVLKALGFGPVRLLRSVLTQTLLVIALAIPIGLLLAMVISHLIYWFGPLYIIRAFEMTPLLRTLLACFAFASLGAIVPLRLIVRVDPMSVFRA
jgi:putative ABC transport system permease protein